MHILLTNDDGPPSNESSPYVHSLVRTLQNAGHVVSVILPHIQRSWIGKAHLVGQVIKPTYFRPGTLHQDDGTTHEHPSEDGGEEWVLVDGTPATCAQLGLYHFFQERGAVDLVVSGPNYGRNSTSLFSLSSGTIGGAMEAASCRTKAIALSYAFFSRDHDCDLIAAASRLSVKLVEYLYRSWDQDVDVYSVNVPLVKGVEQHKIMYTYTLQNYWSSGSSFTEVPATEDEPSPASDEKQIRQQLPTPILKSNDQIISGHRHKHFKFTPQFRDVYKSVEQSSPGNDGWAINQGYISVTPLKTSFMHASLKLTGELKLPNQLSGTGEGNRGLTRSFHALVNYEDPYVQPLIVSALRSQLSSAYTVIGSLAHLPSRASPCLQITPYENLDFEHMLAHPSTSLGNSFIIRKALIRKHYLSRTVHNWLIKHPDSELKKRVKLTLAFELDYAEFLDEALIEAYELHESFDRNTGKESTDREWWILKPSMSDRGQGIRLFSAEDELRSIFEEWEAENPDPNSESSSANGDDDNSESPTGSSPTHLPEQQSQPISTGIITSQLRHFIVQPYIDPPLLFPSLGNRKFHVRSYVLAVGALRVYVYREMLALFAAVPYLAPGHPSLSASSDGSSAIDMRIHLTNTCQQEPDGRHPGSVLRFWDLPSSSSSSSSSSQPQPSPPSSSSPPASHSRTSPTPPPLPQFWKEDVWTAICAATAELFRAAVAQPTDFQPLPNAVEVFGVDWMVDGAGEVCLLEVNAFPDFGQTGEALKGVIAGLWAGVVGVAVVRFFGGNGGVGDGHGDGRGDWEAEKWGMQKVVDVDLGRR